MILNRKVRGMGYWRNPPIWLKRTPLILVMSSLLIVGCSPSTVPITTVSPTETSQATLRVLPSIVPTATEVGIIPSSPGYEYAAAWVPEGQFLEVRQPAGISSSIVESLPHDQRGILLTGQTSLLGSSTWVEIYRPSGGLGWVKRWNLTEDVSPTAFCVDHQVVQLIERFGEVLDEGDMTAFQELVSPVHGLTVRHDWWNPEVHFSGTEISNLLSRSPNEIDWGVEDASGIVIRGSFREVIHPRLLEVFAGKPEVTCNSLQSGQSGKEAIWPTEYTNINYYSFHRPAPVPGNPLNWRTWAVGIEYVEGLPYLLLLVQYRGEI